MACPLARCHYLGRTHTHRAGRRAFYRLTMSLCEAASYFISTCRPVPACLLLVVRDKFDTQLFGTHIYLGHTCIYKFLTGFALSAVDAGYPTCLTPEIAAGLACLGANLGRLQTLKSLTLNLSSVAHNHQLDVAVKRILQNGATALLKTPIGEFGRVASTSRIEGVGT